MTLSDKIHTDLMTGVKVKDIKDAVKDLIRYIEMSYYPFGFIDEQRKNDLIREIKSVFGEKLT